MAGFYGAKLAGFSGAIDISLRPMAAFADFDTPLVRFACSSMGAYPAHMLMTHIASDGVLNEAFEWLCHKRKDYPPSADVWSLRRDWENERVQLQASLRARLIIRRVQRDIAPSV
ncbi:MAG: hypothetical protein ACJAVR_003726 [Paracoccaceae bacterium]